jgi:hypothetical protein
VIPLCDFGVGEEGVVTADDTGGETTSNGVVRWVEAFFITSWIVFVLPIAVLCCINVNMQFSRAENTHAR